MFYYELSSLRWGNFNWYFADPVTAFAMEVAENNSRLKEQTGLKVMEIFSDEKYKIESEVIWDIFEVFKNSN